MQEYFSGAVPQLIARAEELELKIRSDLPVDYYRLADLCRENLSGIREQLHTLLCNPTLQAPRVQGERLRMFRRCRKELTHIESRGIATLDRVKKEDSRFNAFLRRIAKEINHVDLPPVVSPLSSTYFSIDTSLSILFVPLVENRFLLHLPDVYHELGHQCFRNDLIPRLRPVVQAREESYRAWIQHFFDERRRLRRSRGPKSREANVELAMRCVPGWIVELFCDLFAVFTVGPAYVWSHLHLSALYGNSPYDVPLRDPTTHPADEARMEVMLTGLRIIDVESIASEIKERWNEFKRIGSFTPTPEFSVFYPTSVLEEMVATALRGFKNAGIRGYADVPIDSVPRVLNQAWTRFWSNPTDFGDWEQRAVDSLLTSEDISL